MLRRCLNTWFGVTAIAIGSLAACADAPEPAGVAIDNPLFAGLEVKGPSGQVIGATGDTFDIEITIHNPMRVPVRIEEDPACLLTSVQVHSWHDPADSIPLVGAGNVPCAGTGRGATVLMPGDTILLTHRLVGWHPDDSDTKRWRRAPYPFGRAVVFHLHALQRSVEANLYLNWQGYHHGYGTDCIPLETPADTIRIVTNPEIGFNAVRGRQIQYEVHDTRPNPTSVQVCSWMISAAVDQLSDTGVVAHGYNRFCTADGPASVAVGPQGCLRGVHYFDREAAGTYRLRVATWEGELMTDTFVVAPRPTDAQHTAPPSESS